MSAKTSKLPVSGQKRPETLDPDTLVGALTVGQLLGLIKAEMAILAKELALPHYQQGPVFASAKPAAEHTDYTAPAEHTDYTAPAGHADLV